MSCPMSPRCCARACCSSVCDGASGVCPQTLSHEPQVLRQGLLQLNDVLQSLEPLHDVLPPPGGSVLLRELAAATTPALPDPTLSAHATPLLHGLAAAHAYITTFTQVCKVGQVRARRGWVWAVLQSSVCNVW